MDKDTRNAIERATQRARKLFEEDFAAQLEGDFDIHRDGEVTARAGGHLSARQAFQRERIVAAIEYKRAAGMSAAESVADYLRDAAFTTLNRFVALKMLEVRELVQECITRGEQSAGYREFCGLAPGLPRLPDSAGYRLYIESLFDELSTEVKVLFDRRDSSSVLWPRRQTFEASLAVLNDPQLEPAWTEDETLGWFYQYFNSSEERRDMREESQAPRDSRELAIRNQFFTPKYVVGFLVDNTLARQWVEMYGPTSSLHRRCGYLVAPGDGQWVERAAKDPRDIRVLDPACGSAHFLLYAFDIFTVIYEEAWSHADWPPQVDGSSLREDYPTIEALRAAAPALILRRNLFGVDIDGRCAQIAELALWIRAQSWWGRNGIRRESRTSISRTNIVVAEPMPGESELRQSFAESLSPRPLGTLFKAICERLELASELGVLLRIEGEIRDLISDAEASSRQGKLFDHADGGALTFWHLAEEQLLRQLARYSESAVGIAGVRRRLFGENAAHGVALIDILQARFDVALMNPPFGKASTRGKEYFDEAYSNFKTDIGLAFVSRMTELLAPGGLVGAITSRNFLAVDTFKWFRQRVLLEAAPPAVLLDLGYGILDAAMVEAAAYVLEPGRDRESTFYRVLESREKEDAIRGHFLEHMRRRDLTMWTHSVAEFRRVPLQVLCYWLPKAVLEKITSLPPLSESGGAARHGLQTTDDFRFLRLRWEVIGGSSGRWVPIAKGGEYQPFWEDLTLTVDWGEDGYLLKTYLADKRLRLQGSADWTPWLNHSEYYFMEGLTYPERTTSDFSPRILPPGAAFSGTGIAIQCASREKSLAYLGGAYTRVFKMVTESFVGSGDNAFSGSAAKRYRSGLLNQIPAPLVDADHDILVRVVESASVYWHLASLDETAATFTGTFAGRSLSLRDAATDLIRWKLKAFAMILQHNEAIELAVCRYYSLADTESSILEDLVGPHPNSYPPLAQDRLHEALQLYALSPEALMERAISDLGARRQLTKKSYIADRKLELVAHVLGASASSVAELLSKELSAGERDLHDAALNEMSFAVGVAFGRWRVDARPRMDRTLTVDELFTRPVAAAARRERASPVILVDDAGHPSDVITAAQDALRARWGDVADAVLDEIEKALCSQERDLRSWMGKRFFDCHLGRYQDARRRAPVYLQMGCKSSRYSVWVYYPTMSQETLFAVLQDCITPKIRHEETVLAQKRSAVGGSARQRRDLQAQETFVEELKEFAEQLRIAANLWVAHHDDGTVVACAPLWRLFQGQRAWQGDCREAWQSLEAGEFDWAHTAMHLWPDRVVPKCAGDRSLAIAHGLEDVFWIEGNDGKWTARKTPTRTIDELVRERTSPAVKSALKSLLEAPAATGKSAGRGRGGRRKAAAAADEGGA